MAPSGPLHTVVFAGASDGDASRWPQRGLRREDHPATYLTRLASRYMTETNRAQTGHRYVLDRLPPGYGLFAKTRDNDPNHVDRYLYGHPSYTFRSAAEFYEHFRCLQDKADLTTCACIGCRGGRKRSKPSNTQGSRPSKPTGRPSGTTRPKGRPAQINRGPDASPQTFLQQLPQRSNSPEHEIVDEEGTPDPYYRLVKRLNETGFVDAAIKEPDSLDWRITRKQIQRFIKDVKSLPAFAPRIGEIVLFVRGIQATDLITYDEQSNSFMLWDSVEKILKEVPPWEAGVVTDMPGESFGFDDLQSEQSKTYGINYSGYRIEPLDAVGDEKRWSIRSAQVHPHEIRPFGLYRELLKGKKPPDFHPTVQNALTFMSSLSLFEKYHFRGKWPAASVFCRGIFLGSELIMPGDTVRLIPSPTQPQTQVIDVVQITSIRLKLIHLDARDNPDFDVPLDGEDWTRHHDCCIHIEGIGFTKDQSRAWGVRKLPVSQGSPYLPASIRGYGDWYHLHEPSRRYRVPFNRILGRCFEAEATKAWFHSIKAAGSRKTRGFAAVNQLSSQVNDSDATGSAANDLSKGYRGITSAQKYATTRDPRIQRDQGKTWFWADHRVEQLDLQEVKGQFVGPILHGAPARDVKAWRRALMIREKGPGHSAKMPVDGAAALPVGQGRPAMGGGLMQASAVGTAGPLETVEESESEEESEETTDSLADMPIASGRGTVREVLMEPAKPAERPKEVPMIHADDVAIIHSGDESSEVESEEE